MNIVYIPNRTPHESYREVGPVLECKGQKVRFIGGSAATILVTDLTPITRAILQESPCVKIVATLTTGTDHIDTAYLKEHGIRLVTLLDCPGYVNISSTAEHTLGLMLSLARNYYMAYKYMGSLTRDSLRGYELQGKTLGVIGYGRIGKMVAHYGEALGMKPLIYDPTMEHNTYDWAMDPNTIATSSDIVTIHIPLNEFTQGMIDEKFFALMKPTAYFINTSRGEIVQEGALLKALTSGTIAGAASDFYDNDLLNYARTHTDLIVTPHLGGCTFEGIEKADALIAQKLKEILSPTYST